MALRELTVENLAVVESVRVALAPGFTVLTGETGAGKSLVVDAVALALGARASADQVRTGTDAARVEAVFVDVPRDADAPLDELIEDGTAIVRREVTADGRSVVRVNDRAVTVGALASLGARLGEIHGQHEQQRLLVPDRQTALLDRLGALTDAAAFVADRHRAWRATAAAAIELTTDPHELARRVDLLRHQSDEISAAALHPGEDMELDERLRAAQHAESIARSAETAVGALRDDAGALDALRSVEGSLLAAAAHDRRFAELAERAAAQDLERRVNAELPPLGLPAGAFGIEFGEGEIGPNGADRITFTFAPNPGEPPPPLGRIASGGEASRLSLALKVVLAAADETPLLVFDEVDAGVGGRNAAAVGERLKALSAHHQVLCVTHLAQVAAHADAHVVVGKRTADGRTVTEARLLSS